MPAFAKCPWNDDIYGLHPFFQFGFRESRGTYRSHDLENFFLTGGLEIAAHRSLQSLGVLVAQVLETRSEEHTSELQSLTKLVCRLLLETKNSPVTNALTTLSTMNAQPL